MSIQTDKTIAIIGGNGFIGSHLCREILGKKLFSTLYIIDRARVTLFEGGVQSGITADEFREKKLWNKVDTVIYLAWDSTPYSSMNESDAPHNLSVLDMYLHQLSDAQLKQFIFISSAGALYKSIDKEVFTERSVFSMNTLYAEEKIEAEKILIKELDNIDNLIILRPSNIYGPGQYLKLGMGIIPYILKSIKDDIQINLYEPFSSQRDYLFINDFVSIIRYCLLAKVPTGIFNVSSGVNTSLDDLLQEMEIVINKKILHNLSIRNEANKSIISSKKIREISNWCPKVNINDGLTHDWFMSEH